ncbi:helix-turn-helix domain-containing protein [Sphingomonas arantia]|uniref:Helix-turn-helix domain-containing protein n=1 Tax=Sphingomonas arantia TaxID=1460676 RepID=A0ABW4TYU8_9SPHN
MATNPASPALKPRTIQINDAAAYLSISRSSIYRLIETKRVRSIKVGRRTLVDVASLDAFVTNAPTVTLAA